jgi:hypothetical protein
MRTATCGGYVAGIRTSVVGVGHDWHGEIPSYSELV